MTVGGDHVTGIEVRHLAALEAVAEEGSFRRAAARLGYVQSAISEQIAALERIVGQRLVERSRGAGRVELTDAGEVLLGHAKAIVARIKAAEADLGALSGGEAGSLRLGIYQSVGARVIPRLLPLYAREWPDVRVLPREAPTDAALFELVERGELDLSFADMPLRPGPFDHTQVLVDPYILLVPADSPLAGNGPVGLEDVAELPLIGHVTCRVLPRVELADEMPVQPRLISLFWHRDRYRSPAAVGFVEAAVEICAQVTAELDGVLRPLVRRSRSA